MAKNISQDYVLEGILKPYMVIILEEIKNLLAMKF